MARCTRCGKFSFFKSFPNGLCENCGEIRMRELQEKKERLRREIAEQERIAAEAAEKLKWEEALRNLRFPKTIDGLHRIYHYDDVKITLAPGALDNPDFHPGRIVETIPSIDVPNAPSEAAIAINGQIVGFLPANRLAGMVVDWHKEGRPTCAAIRSMDKSLGEVQLYLSFYGLRRIDKLLQRNPDPKKIRLTGNRNADMQDSIWCVEDGMECEVEYDDYKEKYLVRCDHMEIGYLPASAEKFADTSSFFIASIETDDNDKYVVWLYAF